MPDLPCLHVHPDHLRLTVHVMPGAKRTEAVGLHGDALKIRLAAPPVEGRANAALVAWLATELGLPRASVELWQGAGSRRKVLRLHGLDAARACECIGAWMDQRLMRRGMAQHARRLPYRGGHDDRCRTS